MKTVFLLAFFVAAVCLDSWVLLKLWQWHCVPLGLPVITFWRAMGINSTVSLVCYQFVPVDMEKDLFDILSARITAPLLFLLIGWVAA